MKNTINEFDFTSAVKNFLGDKVRQAAGAFDFVGDPIIYAALIKNYHELGDSLDRYNVVNSQLKNEKSFKENSDLIEELKDIREQLEVDVTDVTQGLIELTPTGPLGSIGSGLVGFVEKLTIEDIVDKFSEYIPNDLDFPLLGRLTDSLTAIKDIDDKLVAIDEYESLTDVEVLAKKVLEIESISEGRKKTGTKLCSRGKSAAKSKFEVYPSAYANGYAIQVCKGKIKGLDGKKRCSPPYC